MSNMDYWSNMDYRRFDNTVHDLRDCLEHIHDDLSDTENEARDELVRLSRRIIDESECA